MVCDKSEAKGFIAQTDGLGNNLVLPFEGTKGFKRQPAQVWPDPTEARKI